MASRRADVNKLDTRLGGADGVSEFARPGVGMTTWKRRSARTLSIVTKALRACIGFAVLMRAGSLPAMSPTIASSREKARLARGEVIPAARNSRARHSWAIVCVFRIERPANALPLADKCVNAAASTAAVTLELNLMPSMVSRACQCKDCISSWILSCIAMNLRLFHIKSRHSVHLLLRSFCRIVNE